LVPGGIEQGRLDCPSLLTTCCADQTRPVRFPQPEGPHRRYGAGQCRCVGFALGAPFS
jgi:hypothetical protein